MPPIIANYYDDFRPPLNYSSIDDTQVEAQLDELLTQYKVQVETLLDQVTISWQSLLQPLEQMDDIVQSFWNFVSHLSNVQDNPKRRQVYDNCLPKLSAFGVWLGQHEGLFQAMEALSESAEFNDLSQAQQQAIRHSLRDFKLSGIALGAEDKKRYTDIEIALSEASNQFSNHVLDATEAFVYRVESEDDLAGLSDSTVLAARKAAQARGESGWVFTLQAPSYLSVMRNSENRALRETLYRAYISRASDQDVCDVKWDNSELIERIRNLRQEQAELLGFSDYAAYSLATKMAKDADEVETFLLDLVQQARSHALKENTALEVFAFERDGLSDMKPWDRSYYAELLKQKNYGVAEEELRPYFPLPSVLLGMFEIVRRIFSINIETIDDANTWHEDVQAYRIVDSNNTLRGYFYLDLYARDGKRQGAWMADAMGRYAKVDGIQVPVAFLTCNFAQPIHGQPSLLRHDDVVTLFHEFGHGLHHMLTKVNVLSVSGINGVPWDAVELPSQFLENWCWDREAMDLISGHVDTGEKLPQATVNQMIAAKNFHSALAILRQIEFALFDLRLHQLAYQQQSAQTVLDQVREQIAVVETMQYDRFQHGFSHIFAGGYAAGYYSYLWAEVLSADCFSLFNEQGVFDQMTGRRFLQEILEKGGSEDPNIMFENFRGRKPEVSALIASLGLNQ